MKKNFVFDTNVLLYDPESMHKFQDNNIIIPITVIEEIDRFKRDIDEVGRNARHISRHLDDYRQKGRLSEGVPLPGGGTLRIDLGGDVNLLPRSLLGKNEDNLILAVALRLKKDEPNLPVVFVTKDANLRIKADAMGITAMDYEIEGQVKVDELYRGFRTLTVERSLIKEVESGKFVQSPVQDISPNEFVVFKDKADPQAETTVIARLDPQEGQLKAIPPYMAGVWGIKARNLEQRMTMDLLLDDRVQLITLVGKAGTGKTLISLAVGLFLVTDENRFQKLLVSRPVFPMGKDLGFLPGDVQEKMRPWMQPIFDNVDLLLHVGKGKGGSKKSKACNELEEMGMLEIEALTYIRGRSIPNQFMIVDEAQNLSPHEVKTIVTRVGEGTKIVLTGDPYQIDAPYLDSQSNGLSYTVTKFQAQPLAGHMFLEKGERSALAELAANIL